MSDPDECRNCYHDRSWHNPECDECVDAGEEEPCLEFVE